jgi:hypothetical protein
MTIWKTKIADEPFKIVSIDFSNQPDYNATGIYPHPVRNVIGIGFETKRDGTYLRAAVEMRKDPSFPELCEAVAMLFKAYTDPENPEVKVVRGSVDLTPHIMQSTALLERNQVEAK